MLNFPIFVPPHTMSFQVGLFKGEPVYSRSCVVACKTAEQWMRETPPR